MQQRWSYNETTRYVFRTVYLETKKVDYQTFENRPRLYSNAFESRSFWLPCWRFPNNFDYQTTVKSSPLRNPASSITVLFDFRTVDCLTFSVAELSKSGCIDIRTFSISVFSIFVLSIAELFFRLPQFQYLCYGDFLTFFVYSQEVEVVSLKSVRRNFPHFK